MLKKILLRKSLSGTYPVMILLKKGSRGIYPRRDILRSDQAEHIQEEIFEEGIKRYISEDIDTERLTA